MTQETIQFFPGAVKRATKDCKSADLWKVPPQRLRRHPGFNVRVKNQAYADRVRELAESIKANGYYADKPMAGFAAREGDEDIIIITDGHTRLDAVELAISEGAEIEVVPVVTKPAGTSMEDLTVALVMSNNGSPLKPYETAEVCKRLIGYGMDETTIAKRLGYTMTHVQNLLLLMSAPSEVREMVKLDQVSASLAIETLRKHGPAALGILKQAVKSVEEDGGGRVTAKKMDKASEKRGERVVRLPKPALVKSVAWLKDQGLHEDPNVIKFLSFLSGLEDDAKLKELIAECPAAAQKAGEGSVS